MCVDAWYTCPRRMRCVSLDAGCAPSSLEVGVSASWLGQTEVLRDVCAPVCSGFCECVFGMTCLLPQRCWERARSRYEGLSPTYSRDFSPRSMACEVPCSVSPPAAGAYPRPYQPLRPGHKSSLQCCHDGGESHPRDSPQKSTAAPSAVNSGNNGPTVVTIFGPPPPATGSL